MRARTKWWVNKIRNFFTERKLFIREHYKNENKFKVQTDCVLETMCWPKCVWWWILACPFAKGQGDIMATLRLSCQCAISFTFYACMCLRVLVFACFSLKCWWNALQLGVLFPLKDRTKKKIRNILFYWLFCLCVYFVLQNEKHTADSVIKFKCRPSLLNIKTKTTIKKKRGSLLFAKDYKMINSGTEKIKVIDWLKKMFLYFFLLKHKLKNLKAVNNTTKLYTLPFHKK